MVCFRRKPCVDLTGDYDGDAFGRRFPSRRRHREATYPSHSCAPGESLRSTYGSDNDAVLVSFIPLGGVVFGATVLLLVA